MRAIVVSKHGDPHEALTLVDDAKEPQRRTGQVLIEVHCSSVNPVDYKVCDGSARLLGPSCPYTPGRDAAGVVLEADEGSTFKKGDRVMGLQDHKAGTWAEKILMPESSLARIPDSLSFEQAAAMPLGGLTAWQALDLAQLQPGDRVLIHAGAGGVGSMAIPIAKARGLHVITTCSGRNIDFVKGLGADEVIDYTQLAFDDVLKDAPVNAVLDLVVLKGYRERSMKCLKAGGTYVDPIASPKAVPKMLLGLLRSALWLGPRYRVILVAPNGKQLSELAALAEQGKLKVEVQSVVPLNEAAEGMTLVKSGHVRGKVVIRVR